LLNICRGCHYFLASVKSLNQEFGTSKVTFPSDLEIEIIRQFKAPVALVFDVFTLPEHVSKTFATNGEEFIICDIDLQVGGGYHYVLVTKDGVECSFRGKYLELQKPQKTVATWKFDGWPDTEAIETVELKEIVGGTESTWSLRFKDLAGRSRMTRTDGPEANFESVATYLANLLPN
jgi:uncharacterized protein YndB with AHSA1/START domain